MGERDAWYGFGAQAAPTWVGTIPRPAGLRSEPRFQVLFERLGDFGRIVDAGKYRNENDGLWCLKTISGHRPGDVPGRKGS